MEGSSEEVIMFKEPIPDILHTNLIINSGKLQSAQGSVYYCKFADNMNKECVLKIYKENDFKAYDREI